MTEQTPLERRYRRLLRFYPASFRSEHEEEMITVLVQGAGPGRLRPTTSEVIDLARNGFRARLAALNARFPGRWEREHAKAMFPIRLAIAAWLCLLSALLIGCHRSLWWLLFLFVPAIAAHLYLAYWIRPGAGRRSV